MIAYIRALHLPPSVMTPIMLLFFSTIAALAIRREGNDVVDVLLSLPSKLALAAAGMLCTAMAVSTSHQDQSGWILIGYLTGYLICEWCQKHARGGGWLRGLLTVPAFGLAILLIAAVAEEIH